MSLLLSIGRFLILACTDLAMLPALSVMKHNRRHFEMFIGCFHLIISILFNVSEALGVEIFLRELDWHYISDILSVTYTLLLCIHVMGIPDEDTNIILRYLAFSLTWIAKARDKWDSTAYEMILVAPFVLGVLYRTLGIHSKPPLYRIEHVKKSAAFAAGAGISFLFSRGDVISQDPLRIFMGIVHVCGGMAIYHAWLAVPCKDKKTDDDMTKYSSYV